MKNTFKYPLLILSYLLKIIAIIPLILGFFGVLILDASEKIINNVNYNDDCDVYTHGPLKGLPKN